MKTITLLPIWPLGLASLLISLIAPSPAAKAAMDALNVEARVQSDLNATLSRVLPRESYLVHVTTNTETVSERKLLEGETVTQNLPKSDPVVPPLPGFELPRTAETAGNPGQSRQVFKNVEKEVLKSVAVQITYDQSLPREQTDSAKDLVSKYLSMNFGSKAQANFSAIHMIALPADSTPTPGVSWLPWAISTFLGLSVLALMYSIFRKRSQPPLRYPSAIQNGHGTVDDIDIEDATVVRNPALSALPPPAPTRPLALPSGTSSQRGKYPRLPATRDFVDRRAELLEHFLKSSDTFRLYFTKLPEAAQLELYAALRGPAFDSLLEALELDIPAGGDTTPPPTEEQMLFYLKNFNEFMQTNSWQTNQFFGFLKQLTTDQLVTLIKQENPLVGALMLKFMKSQQSAQVLGAMNSSDRQAVLGQFSRISEIPTAELISIEEAVREQVNRLPKFLLGYSNEGLGYWTKILTQAENQDAILGDLEKSRPELYPQLARFRFKLEDIPSLPLPLITRVLDEVDNDELSLALASLPRDIASYVLAELPPHRRALLSSQMTLVNGLPTDKLKHARQTLTMRFREVMA